MMQHIRFSAGGGFAPPTIFVDNVSKTYAGAVRPVLDGLSVSCPAGRITVIVGPSGCGKTTLLRCLCGLEPIGSGAIRFGDADVSNVDAQKRGVAMVFQNYALYPSKTVAENIAFPLRMAAVPKAERLRRVEAAARLVRIETLLDRVPAQLSGGQRQRVGIARAIVRGPRVLLMDEPLSNLDTKLRAEMRTELALLQQQIGATTVYVTHDQTEALALADHLIILREGAVEQQGAPADVFRRPASIFVADFLGSMNLIAAEGAGASLRFGDGGEMRLPAGHEVAPGERLILGFRAEDMRVGSPGPRSLCLTADVVRSELLGTDSLVHLSATGQALRARLAVPVPAGKRLALTVDAEHLHFFSANGQRIGGAGDS
jgi:ABC-type sugar transport system ATPase subunit